MMMLMMMMMMMMIMLLLLLLLQSVVGNRVILCYSLAWPLTIYEVALSRVEWIERTCNM